MTPYEVLRLVRRPAEGGRGLAWTFVVAWPSDRGEEQATVGQGRTPMEALAAMQGYIAAQRARLDRLEAEARMEAARMAARWHA